MRLSSRTGNAALVRAKYSEKNGQKLTPPPTPYDEIERKAQRKHLDPLGQAPGVGRGNGRFIGRGVYS